MSENNVQVQASSPLKNMLSAIVIIGSLVVGYGLYALVFGADSNFQDNSSDNDPVTEGIGKWFGLIYKGGFLVGIAIALLLIVVTFTIERFITLTRAAGTGGMDVFVQKIQIQLDADDVDGAIAECDRQKGAVGNVVKESLKKYKQMAADKSLDKEKKLSVIKKALEEATALELPGLNKHLTIVATIVSIATLIGLIGTVLGMIRAFAALGTAGNPDASALANGISEALVNTALGISTSTIATVAYNYFTSRIDDMTYRIDEAGISIVETFNEKYS